MFHYSKYIFNDILQELIYTENLKKAISKDILLAKNDLQQQKLIYDFLCYDMDKHVVLEQAARVAIENDDYFLIKQLELLYKYCEGLGLLDRIHAEIAHSKFFVTMVEKAIENSRSISFVERRLLKEINKYVITQARYYCQPTPCLS